MTTSWMRSLSEVLDEQRLIPMWGNLPPFSWEQVSHALSHLLKSTVTLKPGASDWKESGLLSGLGEDPVVVSLCLAPLSVPLFIALPKSDVAKLTRDLIDDSGPGLQDDQIASAFFQYAVLELLADLESPYGDLSPQLSDHHFEESKSYVIDVAMEKNGQTLWLRVICPQAFHQEIRNHFANQKIDLANHPLADEVTIPLILEIGHTSLSSEAFDNVNVGDFIILDRCSYRPAEQKGSVMITCGDKALFQARIKDGEMKILDYAYSYEESENE